MDEETWNALEALTNLMFLIEHEANDKGRLRMYTKLASETLQHLTRALKKPQIRQAS